MERNNCRIINSGILFFLILSFFFTIRPLLSEESTNIVLMDKEISVKIQTREAFSAPIPILNLKKMRFFTGGRHLFRRSWTIAPSSVKSLDGLGPVFNRNSCSGCHVKDGRGKPPKNNEELRSMVLKLALIKDKKSFPDPNYGFQLNDKAILGVEYEGKVRIDYTPVVVKNKEQETILSKPKYHLHKLSFGPINKNTLISPRVAPFVFGLGLIEAIEDDIIKGNADPEDKNNDGISGRYNLVWDEPSKRKLLGRFGWKAARATLLHQIVGAAHEDMGLTSKYLPNQNCTAVQKKCLIAPSGGNPEITEKQIKRLLLYMQTLAPPRQRNPENKEIVKGEILFKSIGCAACHISSYQTGKHPDHKELSYKTIKPYSDFLLHDMGTELADGMPAYEASGQEWRTPPLWGIGLIKRVNKHSRFLHDGRAQSLEEAILWHGGEGEISKTLFLDLKKSQKKLLIKFLKSL